MGLVARKRGRKGILVALSVSVGKGKVVGKMLRPERIGDVDRLGLQADDLLLLDLQVKVFQRLFRSLWASAIFSKSTFV